MEKHISLNSYFVMQMQQNNPVPKEYIQCWDNLVPKEYIQCRNKIAFKWGEKNSIIYIVNSYIANIIQFLSDYNFQSCYQLIIQANEYNCGIIINSGIDFEYIKLVNNILLQFNICYLEINNNIIINNKFLDIICNNIIYRNIHTFHQTEELIKNMVIDFVIKNGNNFTNLICIGGEMYIFSKILKYKNLFCYSDFQSIVDDTKFNNDKFKDNIYLVDYNTVFITKIISDTCIIVNISKQGLGYNLAININNTNVNNIIIISCNKNQQNSSFSKNIKLLTNYNIIKYSSALYVTIYLLNCNKV